MNAVQYRQRLNSLFFEETPPKSVLAKVWRSVRYLFTFSFLRPLDPSSGAAFAKAITDYTKVKPEQREEQFRKIHQVFQLRLAKILPPESELDRLQQQALLARLVQAKIGPNLQVQQSIRSMYALSTSQKALAIVAVGLSLVSTQALTLTKNHPNLFFPLVLGHMTASKYLEDKRDYLPVQLLAKVQKALFILNGGLLAYGFATKRSLSTCSLQETFYLSSWLAQISPFPRLNAVLSVGLLGNWAFQSVSSLYAWMFTSPPMLLLSDRPFARSTWPALPQPMCVKEEFLSEQICSRPVSPQPIYSGPALSEQICSWSVDLLHNLSNVSVPVSD